MSAPTEPGTYVELDDAWADPGWARVPNSIVRCRDLSLGAKGLVAELASFSPGYRLTVDDLIAGSTDGRDAHRTKVRELEDAGYITRHQHRDRYGRFGVVVLRLHVTPQKRTSPESSQVTPATASPATDDPGPGKPATSKKTSLLEEQTQEPSNPPSADASAAQLQLVLPGTPPAPVQTSSKRTTRKTKTEPQTRAHEIVDAWILAFRATGVEPTKRQIGAAARTAKELLQAGNEFERVLFAARSAGARGYTTIDRELAHLATNGRRLTAVGSNSRSPYVDTRSNDDYSGELQ